MVGEGRLVRGGWCVVLYDDDDDDKNYVEALLCRSSPAAYEDGSPVF